jgi:hypothetical protein
MANGKDVTRTRIDVSEGTGDVTSPKQAEEALLKAGAHWGAACLHCAMVARSQIVTSFCARG